MLKTLNFVKGAVSTKDLIPVLTNFHFYSGRVQGGNGRITIDAPLELGGIDITVPAVPFLKAIDTCEGILDFENLKITEAGRLSIKKGKFRSVLPLSNSDEFPLVEPSEGKARHVPPILSALKRLRPFVGDDATRPWACGVLFKNGYAYATNNVVMTRVIMDFGDCEFNLPGFAVDELLRINKEPESIIIDDNAVTFFFGKLGWLRSQLFSAEWPDVERFFEEHELDPDRWTTCYWWDDNGCTNLANNEQQWYRPENISIEDGSLVLTARREEVIGWEGREFPYTSGLVTTGRYYDEHPRNVRFAATEGIFEMRARIPGGKGMWPAFWLLPTSLESEPEIDIMEVLGHRPHVLELHFQYLDDRGRDVSVGHEVRTSDLTKDWHVYGVDWSSERIVWYLDGKEVWRYTDRRRIPDEPMYIIVNLAVGGDWPGNPDSSTEFPARMEVDYVRAWSRRK